MSYHFKEGGTIKRCFTIHFVITLHSFSKSILICLGCVVYRLYFSFHGNRRNHHIHILQLGRQAVSSETLTWEYSSVWVRGRHSSPPRDWEHCTSRIPVSGDSQSKASKCNSFSSFLMEQLRHLYPRQKDTSISAFRIWDLG